ncbi:MAG: YraN family protein [Elusimicrobiales bacterium]|nr:YraN family protein [Elusimicrobiales bacterium]
MLKEGQEYEDLACTYLKKNGFSIKERNYSSITGEIDIVAAQGKTLVFIEVKGRANEKFGSPFEAVNKPKQRKIIKTAICFIKQNKLKPKEIRFDVVGINPENEIEHIENAFQTKGYFY